jgi:hypothetical protein
MGCVKLLETLLPLHLSPLLNTRYMHMRFRVVAGDGLNH